ncbi:CAP-Gly domain-containing linker protein 1 [Trichinella pseudospiralis]|uniref:CAP-Gly domain-containing linker protein 1 n=1 Tax=Trichinella pseudospiralis TaxID=6337 RepID=A0A0V1ETD9_TRIPS|nr:CAP-Gly domain-containing linker protein 1 [Trichinella pseudospiralis]KRZ22727.1 CAP-Gly domain-containing linker protein 1 [Trichinella pseudospiralis]
MCLTSVAKTDAKGGGFQSHLRRPSQFRRNKPADIIPTAVASKLPTLDGISVPRAVPNQSTLIPVEQLLSSTFEKHIGNRVRVAGEKAGSLRYIGTVQGREGFYCGIELDEPVGSHDGALNGIRYFQTNPNRAIFAPLDRVEVIVDQKPSFKPVDCWMNDVEPLLISSCCSEDPNSDLMVQSDISLAGSPPANSSLLAAADLTTTPYQATSEADLFSVVDVQKSPSASLDNTNCSKQWSKEATTTASVCPVVDDLNVTITVDDIPDQHTVCFQSAENPKPALYCNSDDIQSELTTIKSDDDEQQQLSTFDNKMVNLITSCNNTISSQSTSSAITTLSSTDEAVVRKELLVPSKNKKIKYEPNKITIKSSDSAKRISMAKVTPNRTQVRTIQRVPSKPSKHAEIMAKLKESIKQDKEKGKKEVKSRIAQSIQVKPAAKITAPSQNTGTQQFPSSKQSSQESSSSNEACHGENRTTKGVTVRNRSANDISKHITSTKSSDMVPKLRAPSRFDDAFVKATSFYHYNPNSAVSCFHCGACVLLVPHASVVLRDSAYSSNMTNDRIGNTQTRSSSYTLHPVSKFVQSFQPVVNSKKDPASTTAVKRQGNGPLGTSKRSIAKAPVLEKKNSTSIKRMVDEHKYQEIVKGFLALSVTFNHYQDHLIPVLRQRNANVKNELEKLKAAFESTVCEYEKIKEEREELCKQHAKTIDELNAKHREAIRCLEITLKQEHDQHLKQICEDNEKILDKLRSTFDEKIKTKDVKIKSEKCQIEVCQLDHHSPVQDVDRKEQVIADVRYVNHVKEIDSLRAVLEMKTEENRELRSRLAEREKEIEEAMKMKSRLILLDQKNAELKEALELKKTTEKRLSQRHHDLVRSCEREKENSRRLQMDKEQLQFQLERVLMSQSAYDTPISRFCSSSESSTTANNVQDEMQQNSMSQSLIQIYADCSPRYSKELPVTFYSNEGGVEKKIFQNDHQQRSSSLKTLANRGKIGRRLTTSARSRHFSNSSDAGDADAAYMHRRRVQSDCEIVEKENQRMLPNCTGRSDLPASESSNEDSMLMTVGCTDCPERCSQDDEKRCQLASGSTDYCKGDNCMQKVAASCIDSGIFTASYHSDIFDTPPAVSGTEQKSKHVLDGQVGGDFAEQS